MKKIFQKTSIEVREALPLKSVFKPIVASSLALALGINVASAACTSTNGSGMAICGNGTDISQTLGIDWGSISSNVYQPQHSSSPIKSLVFQLGKSNDSGSGNADKYIAEISGNTLTIEASGKTLQMDNGTGTLSVELGQGTQNAFTLNAANIKGNLEVLGGGVFTASIAGDFLGNLNIGSKKEFGNVQGNPTQTHYTHSIVNIGGDFTGNLRTGVGRNAITFAKDNVHFNGNILATNDYGVYAESINTITFNHSATIGSSSENTITADKGENNFSFKGETNTINSKIVLKASTDLAENYQASNTNHIVFESSTQNNTILGLIQSNQGIETGGKNWIEFKNASGTSTIGSEATKGSNIIEAIWGTNKIDFSGNAVSKILGDISASGAGYVGAKAVNTITFGTGTGAQSIEGNIMAEAGGNGVGGSNNVTFASSTSSTIIGNILTQNNYGNGENTITFNGAGTNAIQGYVRAYAGDNTINGSIGVHTVGTQNTKTQNIIDAQWGTNNITLAGDKASTIYGNINASGSGREGGKAVNTVTFKAGAGDQSIEGDIIASAGINGKAGENSVTFNSTKSSTINGNIYAMMTTTSGINKVTFSGAGNNSITGFIKTDYKGSNTVEFKAGTNTIGTTETIGKDIIIANGGTNSISSTNGLNINGNIIAKANFLSPYNGSINTIDISGTAASSIQGDIIAENGQGTSTQQNNIKIKGDNTVNSNLIGNIINDYGKINVILDQTIWAPTNVSSLITSIPQTVSTGSVTTKGGETTVIYRQGNANILSSGVGEFNINNQNGTTNIVMQTGANELHMKSNINYSAGTINLIFARGNNGDSSVTGGAGGAGAQSENFKGTTDSSQNTFFGITYQDGVKLTIQDIKTDIGNRQNVSILQEYGRYALSSQYLLSVDSDRDRTNAQDSVGLSGLIIGSITQLDASTTKKTYNVNLNANSVFIGNIDLNTTVNTINLVMEDKSKMILTSDVVSIAKLTVKGSTKINAEQFAVNTLDQSENKVINLATGGASSNNVTERNNFRALGIEKIDGTGSLVFVNYVNQNANQDTATLGEKDKQARQSNAYADRVIINGAGTDNTALSGEYYMQLALDSSKTTNLSSIHYEEGKGADKTSTNIAVATIKKQKNASTIQGTSEADIRSKGVITLQEANSLQGFDELATTLKAVETTQNGIIDATSTNNNYITYFVDSVKTLGTNTAVQESTSTIAAASLDIYMANFNSLNKRMGELRDNTNSQGAWGRIFGGQQSSDFGLGSTTGYVTVQAGYDYAFGFEGANNYLGFALAYGYSSSSTNSATNTLSGANEGIEGELKSNMVEVGIYNAYVQDEGWYNDSIFKFSYMMQDFTQSGTASGNSVSTNNFGIILSDEFGYRFKLGDAKEWYIDPQLEVAFGYVNGTEYTQISGLSTLDTKVDALMQLRARFGSSFGYDFKQFTQGKGVDAKLYLGMFYEYDYFNGGDLTLTTNLGGVNSIQSDLSSDGRVVMNVGTNVTVKENTRIYFDFETSFAGKIRTDYQANVGVRYSFGENTSYVPASTKIEKKDAAPLKVEEAKEQPQTTEQKAQ